MQPVYGVTLQSVKDVISEATSKHVSGYAFGNSDPDNMKQFFITMFKGDKGLLPLSLIVNQMKDFETGKMLSGANTAIVSMVRSLQLVRTVMSADQLSMEDRRRRRRIAEYSCGSAALNRGKFVTKKEKESRKEKVFKYFFDETCLSIDKKLTHIGHDQTPISYCGGKVYQWGESGWYYVPELSLGDLEGFEVRSK
jgi:hypothetical protein